MHDECAATHGTAASPLSFASSSLPWMSLHRLPRRAATLQGDSGRFASDASAFVEHRPDSQSHRRLKDRRVQGLFQELPSGLFGLLGSFGSWPMEGVAPTSSSTTPTPIFTLKKSDKLGPPSVSGLPGARGVRTVPAYRHLSPLLSVRRHRDSEWALGAMNAKSRKATTVAMTRPGVCDLLAPGGRRYPRLRVEGNVAG